MLPLVRGLSLGCRQRLKRDPNGALVGRQPCVTDGCCSAIESLMEEMKAESAQREMAAAAPAPSAPAVPQELVDPLSTNLYLTNLPQTVERHALCYIAVLTGC